MRSVNEVTAEISDLIKFKDLTIMRRIISQHYPKSKGFISKLEVNQLEKLLVLLREAYSGKE